MLVAFARWSLQDSPLPTTSLELGRGNWKHETLWYCDPTKFDQEALCTMQANDQGNRGWESNNEDQTDTPSGAAATDTSTNPAVHKEHVFQGDDLTAKFGPPPPPPPPKKNVYVDFLCIFRRKSGSTRFCGFGALFVGKKLQKRQHLVNFRGGGGGSEICEHDCHRGHQTSLRL